MNLKRVAVGSFLMLCLFLVCSNYVSSEEYTNSTVQELFFNYPPNQIFVSGIVTEVYPGGFQVSAFEKGNSVIYQVKTESKVDLDDTVYILGNLNSFDVINCIKLFTVKKSDFNFVIIRSVGGLILFLIIFGRYWKFNFKTLEFVRRRQ